MIFDQQDGRRLSLWAGWPIVVVCLGVVVTCLGVVVPQAVWAAPRNVAVVNMAGDQAAGARAVEKIRIGLLAQDKLAPIPEGDLSRALERPLSALSATARQILAVRALFGSAHTAKAKFAYAAALRKLTEAETILLGLAPSAQINALLAETNFRAGLIHAADHKTALALRSFRTVRTLAPRRVAIDPSRYAPSIVALYARAANAPIGNAQTKVTTTYDGATIFLDGRKIGKAPITIALSPGIHYVVATFKGHQPSGRKLQLSAGSTAPTRLRLQSLRIDQKARLVRHRLLNGGQYLEIGRQVARLAQVDAVIIVSANNKAAAAAIYDTHSDLVGAWRSFGSGAIATMLTPLLPLPTINFPTIGDLTPGPTVRTKQWHQKLWVRLGGGFAAVAISVIAVSLSIDNNIPMSQVGGFE